MVSKLMLNLILSIIVAFAIIRISAGSVKWNLGDWAFSCDMPGNDLEQAPTSGDKCGEKCQQTEGCTHFVWTDEKGGTCWMKQGHVTIDNAVPKFTDASVCGILRSKMPAVEEWLGNCDFPGNDFTNAHTRSLECQIRCKQTSGCSHFVWKIDDGGTCFMKKGVVTKKDAVLNLTESYFCGIV